jgi:hypothetical protein
MRTLNFYATEAQASKARARGEFALGADLSDSEIVSWVREHERSGEKIEIECKDEVSLPAVIVKRMERRT